MQFKFEPKDSLKTPFKFFTKTWEKYVPVNLTFDGRQMINQGSHRFMNMDEESKARDLMMKFSNFDHPWLASPGEKENETR